MKRSLNEEKSNSYENIKRFSKSEELKLSPEPQAASSSDGGGYEMTASQGSKMREAFNYYKDKTVDLSNVRDVRVSDVVHGIKCRPITAFPGDLSNIDTSTFSDFGLR